MSRAVFTAGDIEVVVNNVQQDPFTAYTVNGTTTLTFTGAPSVGTGNILVTYRNYIVSVVVPAQGTVTNSTLAAGSVTGDKIASATIGSSNLTSTGVSAGVYGGTGNTVNITVDAQGRITSAANVIATSSQWTSNGSNIHYDAGPVGIVGNPRGSHGGVFRSLEIGSSSTNTLTLFNQVNAAAGGLTVGGYFNSSNQGLYNVYSGQQPTRLYMNDGSFQFLNAPSDVSGNVATFTEQMRISKTGCLVLANGSTSATGTGITFPATQSASTNANTLDDYEEGTFSPTVIGSTTAGTVTYYGRQGTYTKIGNRVHFSLYLNWDSGTGTGNLEISGLPFTSGDAGNPSVIIGFFAFLALSGAYVITGYIPNATSKIGIYQYVGSGSTTFTTVPYDTSCGDTMISGSYIV
jgi:hypothetical protein